VILALLVKSNPSQSLIKNDSITIFPTLLLFLQVPLLGAMHAHVRYQQKITTSHVPLNHHHLSHRQQPLPYLSQPTSPPLNLSTKWNNFKCLAAISKQAQRFFSAVLPTVATRDTSATNRLIKKFVASSPKSIALDALSNLLSPDSTHHPLLYLLTLPVSNNPS
jgi:hypothetical protein